MPEETIHSEKLAELQKKFDQTQAALAETRKHLEAVERRRAIDLALIEAEAADLESARLLTEVAVGVMEEADVKRAVEEIKRRKPHLFRRRVSEGGAMSPRPRHDAQPAEQAAHRAALSGDRRDLLCYLRMRRKQT